MMRTRIENGNELRIMNAVAVEQVFILKAEASHYMGIRKEQGSRGLFWAMRRLDRHVGVVEKL